MPTTVSQNKANKTYYEKNKERLKQQMRERSLEYVARIKADPEAYQEYLTKRADEYYKRRDAKISKQLKAYLEDPAISQSFKAFIRNCLLTSVSKLNQNFMKTLHELPIVNAFYEPEDNVNTVIENGDEGTTSITTREDESSEGEEDEEDNEESEVFRYY